MYCTPATGNGDPIVNSNSSNIELSLSIIRWICKLWLSSEVSVLILTLLSYALHFAIGGSNINTIPLPSHKATMSNKPAEYTY